MNERNRRNGIDSPSKRNENTLFRIGFPSASRKSQKPFHRIDDPT